MKKKECIMDILSEKIQIRLTSDRSFEFQGSEYKVKGWTGNSITFETMWETGIQKTKHFRELKMPMREWDKALVVYNEWLKEQNESKICTPDNG